MRQGSPARPGGACGGRMSRQSAAASVDSMELSCGRRGVTRGRPSAEAVERCPDVVLAGVVGGDVDAEERGLGHVAAAARRGGRRSAARGTPGRRPAPRPDCPGRPRTRAAGGRRRRGSSRTSAACRGAWRSSRNRGACRPSASAVWTRSCSPTEAPPRVTMTSARKRDGAADDARRWRRRRRATMPRSCGSPPSAATSAARPTAFEATIWSGPGDVAGRDQLVAGGDDRDARAAAHRDGAVAHRRGERDLRACRAGVPAASRTSPSRKSRPGGADVAAGDGGLADADRAVADARRHPPGSGPRRRRRAPARR